MSTETAEAAFLTIAETAKLLRLSQRTTYALVAAGTLPSVRVGGSLRVPRRELALALARTRRGPGT